MMVEMMVRTGSKTKTLYLSIHRTKWSRFEMVSTLARKRYILVSEDCELNKAYYN